MPRKSKRMTKPCAGILSRIDLPPHPPDEHSGIEVVGFDHPLTPALPPHAKQLDDRSEILAGPRQPIKMTLALRLRLDLHHAGVGELLEALRQHRARYERRR